MRSAPSPRSTTRPRSLSTWLHRVLAFSLLLIGLNTAAFVLAPANAAVRSPEGRAQGQAAEKRVLPASSATTAFPAGSLIIDMGATQTIANGLKPYGFVYEMLTTYKLPVSWAIANGKTAQGAPDFTATGLTDLSTGTAVASKTFSGSSFVVSGNFAQDVPAARLTYWIGQGVKFYRTSGAVNLPQFSELRSWPRIVLDADSGAGADAYYKNAGIPTTAYRFALPAQLTACDDLFVFPHADPTWALHNQLRAFNNNGGYIFGQCHLPSVLENLDDPNDADTAPDLNFLSTNGLVPYGSHSDGTPAYSYTSDWSDPILQFMNPVDDSTLNGSEQIYFPKTGGWRPTTKVLSWDPDHPQLSGTAPISPGKAAIQVYGRGYGNATNGMVMYQAGHDFTKGTTLSQVAAQRAFLNFNLLAGMDRGVTTTTNIPNAPIVGGATIPVSAQATGGSGVYTYKWTSSCGGTFANDTAASTTFTAPTVLTSSDCTVRVTVTDSCGRVSFSAAAVPVQPSADLSVTKVEGADPIRAGDAVNYTLTVTNASTTTDATSVVVTDTLDRNTTLLSTVPSSCTSAASAGTTVVTCNLGTVARGSTQTITINTASNILTGADTFAGSGAQAGSAGTACPDSDICNKVAVTSAVSDPNTANNAYVQPTNVVRPGLSLVKSVVDSNDADTIGSLGETLTYGFTVTNTGVLTLNNVKISDSMLGMSGVACVASLAPGTSTTCPLITSPKTYVVKAADIAAGSVVNTASATATPTLGADVIGTSTATMQTPADPAIKLEKTVADSSDADTIASLGEKLTYTFKVTNTGNVPLTNVTITDNKLGLSDAVCATSLAVGASTTCTGLTIPQYTTSALDVDNGKVTNNATAGATAPSGAKLTSPATAQIATESAKPGMTLTKRVNDANDDGIAQLGEVLNYRFTVSNTGNVPLSNVKVTDAMLGLNGALCVATLPAGESTTCPDLVIPAYTVKDSDIAKGSIVNTATSAARTAGGTDVSAQGTRTVPAPAVPSVKLVKTVTDASGDKVAQQGEKLTYALTVTNTGNVPLSNVTVSDPMLGVDKSVCAPTLAVGASTTCAGIPQYTVKDSDLITGSITNTATTSGTSPQNVTVTAADTKTIAAPFDPSISLVKTVKDGSRNNIAEFGETLTYTFSVVNNGNVALTDVTITDAMLGLDKAPCVATLPVGATTDCPLLTVPAYTVTDDDIDNQTIDNTATAAGTAGSGAGATSVTDAKKVSIATEEDKPAIVIVKKVADSRDPDAAATNGEKLTYKFTVSNVGNVKLTNVRITDTKLGIDDVLCADVIKAGKSVTCSVQGTAYTVDTGDVDKGSVANTATVTGKSKTGKTVTDKSTVTLRVLQNPSLSIAKTVTDSSDSDTVGSLGETLTYGFRITNTGDTTLTNVTLTDPLLGLDGAPCVASLNPGRSTQCPDLPTGSTTYVVKASDIGAGRIDNTATTGAKAPDGSTISTTGFAGIQTPAQPAIRLDLDVADSNDADQLGGLDELLTYTFTVTNTGNVPLKDVTITDPKLGLSKVSCVSTLAVGETATCTISANTYKVTADDVAAGSVNNTATTAGTPTTGGDPVTSSDSAGIATVRTSPSIVLLLAVADSNDPDSVGSLGETLTYTFTVTNNGNVTLSGVVITDSRLGLVNEPCVATLTVGATATCTITAPKSQTTVKAADLDLGKVVNDATTTGTAPDGTKVSDDDTVSILTPAQPRLEIVKTASDSDDADDIASLGEKVTYTFRVTNSGNVPINDVTITDAKLGLDKAPCVASLAVGASTLCPLLTVPAYTTTSGDVSKGQVDNTATAAGKPSSGGSVSVTGSASLPTQSALPAIGLDLTVVDATGDGIAAVGEKLTYSVTVTNNGNVPLKDVTISDPKLGVSNAPCVANLAVGASTDCPLLTLPTYTTTSGDQTNGKVDNSATTAGTPVTGGAPVTAADTVSIGVATAKPSITLTMTVADSEDADYAAQVDEKLVYTYTVTNNGDVPLTNVRISDPDRFIFDAACTQNLAVGASFTCSFTATYTTTGQDVLNGAVTNQATAKALPPSGGDITADATATIGTVNVGDPEPPTGGGGGGGEFDFNWEYEGPTCDQFTVSYPADIPAGQANDVNVRFVRPDGSKFTLNFHNNDGTWSGNQTFVFAQNRDWPAGLTEWTIEWTQVAGTNYHWEGARTCVKQADGSSLEKTSVERWDTVATTVRRGTAVANDAIVVRQQGLSPVLLEKLVGGVWTYVSTVSVNDQGGATVRFPVEDKMGTFAYRVRIAPTDGSTGFTTPVKQVNVN